MSSRTNPTIPELETIVQRISEALQEIQKLEDEREGIFEVVMEAGRKRGENPDVFFRDQSLDRLWERLVRIREAIRLQHLKIKDLQEQERELKERGLYV